MKQASFETLSHIVFGAVLVLLVTNLSLPEIIGKVTEERLWDAVGEMWSGIMVLVASFAYVANFWRSYTLMQRNQPTLDAKAFVSHSLFLFLTTGLIFTSQLVGEYEAMRVAVFIYAMNIACISLSLSVARLYVDRHHVRPSADMIMPFIWAIIALFINIENPALALVILMIGSIIRLVEYDVRFLTAALPYVSLNKRVLGKK